MSKREHGYYWVWNVNNPRDMPEIALWSNADGYGGWWLDGKNYWDGMDLRVISGPLTSPIVPEDLE